MRRTYGESYSFISSYVRKWHCFATVRPHRYVVTIIVLSFISVAYNNAKSETKFVRTRPKYLFRHDSMKTYRQGGNCDALPLEAPDVVLVVPGCNYDAHKYMHQPITSTIPQPLWIHNTTTYQISSQHNLTLRD